jgi:hypothetical protein
MLKKEFKRKDINRMRNLIMGKTGNSSGTQIGYIKKEKEHKEGDVWAEGKKTWTIKNGIKQTVSRLDKIKKEVFVPLCCPKCSKVMKHHLDINSYKIHKNCHKCLVEFEHKLKIKGNFKKYKNDLKKQNNIEYLNEIESYLLDAINISNSSFVSEDGVVERWVGGFNKEEMKDKIIQTTEQLREKINNKD